MILELSFNGFRFFNGPQTLSFAADRRTKALLSNAVPVNGKHVLKCLGIYGPNNTGKSNIIELIRILQMILLGHDGLEINRQLFGDRPLFSAEITFGNPSREACWYRYSFEYNCYDRRYLRESFSSITFYEKGSPLERTIFSKNYNNRELSVFGADHSSLLDVLPSRLPFLYSIELDKGQFAPLKPFLMLLRELADSLVIVDMYNIPIQKTITMLKEGDERQKAFITAFTKDADLSIDNFGYDDNVKLVPTKGISEAALSQLEKMNDAFHLMTTYGSAKVPSILFDSSGTKKVEAIAAYVYEALVQGKTLVVDELDNGLHFRLTRAIVSAFNNLANTKGQLLFTAHDLLLINCKNLMRKEQIYFLSRSKDGASLFCLSEATTGTGGPREGADLLTYYQRGAFGNLPHPSFINEVIEANQGAES